MEPALAEINDYWWVLPLSVAMFIGTLALIPWFVIRLPADYFCRRRRPLLPLGRGLTGWLLWLPKNLAGALLLVAGVAMLVLPGQGILTILLGLMLLDFPGKYQLEHRLLRRPRVLSTLNWLRRRAQRPPLRMPPTTRRR
ncbi:MAG: PGPGW domain-containing protein [Pseudomonadota bacterium]|nr:PGPGW domain-containing protein [Pseudomonadota bacterium]HJO34917.1 PGPGW domain-containing protein [Gammaproteobacteria bacterium]